MRNATIPETLSALGYAWLMGLFVVLAVPVLTVAIACHALWTGNTGRWGAAVTKAVNKPVVEPTASEIAERLTIKQARMMEQIARREIAKKDR